MFNKTQTEVPEKCIFLCMTIPTYFCSRMTMLRIFPANPASPVSAVKTPEMEKCHQDRSASSGWPQVVVIWPEICCSYLHFVYFLAFCKHNCNKPKVKLSENNNNFMT